MTTIRPADVRAILERDLPHTLLQAEASAHEDAEAAVQATPLPAGVIQIQPSEIVTVATYLRDRLGYTYLSDLSVVDYLAQEQFTIVYRFYHTEGGGAVVLKLSVPRAEPHVPSLTPAWPGADFHEREGFDLFGIIFEGHPNLRRIYLWDEFVGHPMRKDFPKQGDKYMGAASGE